MKVVSVLLALPKPSYTQVIKTTKVHVCNLNCSCMFCSCRQHFSQQLPPCLLIALLSSRSADAVSLTLDALLGVARLLPGLLPVQAAARLLELLCSNTHGEQQREFGVTAVWQL